MKTKTLKLLVITSIILLLSQQSLFAQFWNENPAPIPGVFTNFLGTAAGNPVGKRDIRFGTVGVERMRLIGEPGFNIGFLGIGTIVPQSLLNLNSFTSGTGNIFRTDGPNTTTNIWAMHTGATSATSLERYALYVNPLSTNVHQRATSGDMFFETNGAFPNSFFGTCSYRFRNGK